MASIGSSKPESGSSQEGSAPEGDAFDLLYDYFNRPGQQQALEAISGITVEELRRHYQLDGTEAGRRD